MIHPKVKDPVAYPVDKKLAEVKVSTSVTQMEVIPFMKKTSWGVTGVFRRWTHEFGINEAKLSARVEDNFNQSRNRRRRDRETESVRID